MEYHVSKQGNDKNAGTAEAPFLTISRAAAIAEEGDRVIVHKGVYRECVRPANGSRTMAGRIIYEASPGEHAVIKGSESVDNWTNENGINKAVIPNEIFTDRNPYSTVLDGDWYMSPLNTLHTGAVYIDGEMLSEKTSREEVRAAKMSWYAEVNDDETIIYANFGDKDPTNSLTEINVRSSCFIPERTGINYITVRGFEMAHAATQWSPPTSEQEGMLCVNWSKGWIIEDNIFHDARCSAICVGKERSTGHNLATRYNRKPGYQTQLESVFAARRIGWSKELIGSHVIRNNTIYDCGQNGIVGHLGGAFSEIYGNHIYNIGNKHEYFGFEIAGIKLHAAIDTYIHNNNIHDCTLGTWLDWQAQGIRISRNIYHKNETDLFIEVSHGPHIADNNIFGSKHSLLNVSQGGAYVNNLFMGGIKRYTALDRSTPYHLPHSTQIMGTAVVYGGDERFLRNIFVGISSDDNDDSWISGTATYNGHTASIEEYIEKVIEKGRGDVGDYMDILQPIYADSNCYYWGAKSFDGESSKYESNFDPHFEISENNGELYIKFNMQNADVLLCKGHIRTRDLPIPRISEAPYENADGTELVIDSDYFGSSRGISSACGPFAAITAGANKFKIWG